MRTPPREMLADSTPGTGNNGGKGLGQESAHRLQKFWKTSDRKCVVSGEGGNESYEMWKKRGGRGLVTPRA